MNYQAVYDYVFHLTQSLDVDVQFFHARKEIILETTSNEPLYCLMLPLISNGTFNVNGNFQNIWSLNLIFYQQDEAGSEYDQNTPTETLQDEMKILSLTNSVAEEFVRLFEDNNVNDDLREASELLEVQSVSMGNAIKDTALLLTGTTLTINFLVSDTFDYCCGIVEELIAPVLSLVQNGSDFQILGATDPNNGNATGWILEQAYLSYGFTPIAEINLPILQYTAPNLVIGQEYSYRAKAISSSTQFTESDYSNIITATTETSFDPDAQAWIDRMTNPSSDLQQDINQLVVDLKSDTTWNSLDELYIWVNGAVNSLIAAKSKTAIVNGGTTFSLNGAVFDGINSYIDTGFDLSVDSVNYSLNDAAIGSFVFTQSLLANQYLLGTFNNLNRAASILYEGSVTPTRSRLNGSVSTFAGTSLDDKTLNVSVRENSSDTAIYENAVKTSTNSGSNSVPTGNIFVGCTNNNGSPTNYGVSTQCALIIGGDSGINQSTLDNAINTFLTSRGVLP